MGNIHACLCCGMLTLDERGKFEICPECFWEDDDLQAADPHYTGGANAPSLNQARHNYMSFGACERRSLKHVRPPLPEERPPFNA